MEHTGIVSRIRLSGYFLLVNILNLRMNMLKWEKDDGEENDRREREVQTSPRLSMG